MDSKEKAKEIFDALGGKGNIISNATCMTRLRVRVREIISLSELKKIDGVMNVVESNDTLQIVLGPGIVNLVGQEFSKLTEIPLGFSDVKELANENKKINKN